MVAITVASILTLPNAPDRIGARLARVSQIFARFVIREVLDNHVGGTSGIFFGSSSSGSGSGCGSVSGLGTGAGLSLFEEIMQMLSVVTAPFSSDRLSQGS